MIQVKVQAQPKISVNILSEQVVIGDYESYTGEYEVIPKAFRDQELITKDLVLNNNIVVKEIPFFEVSNASGGNTVIIGG